MADDGGACEACIVVVSAGGYQLGGYEAGGAYLLRRLRWLLAFRACNTSFDEYVTDEKLK